MSMNSPMTAPPPQTQPQKRSLASFLPDRKVLAGGFCGLLAWLILALLAPVLARYGISVPPDSQAQLAGLLGLIIAWAVPPSDQDIISRMSNRLVQMANADPGSAVSLPQATTDSPPVEGSTVVVAPKSPPAPPPGKLTAHVWPLLLILPLVVALAGCNTPGALTKLEAAAGAAVQIATATVKNPVTPTMVYDLRAAHIAAERVALAYRRLGVCPLGVSPTVAAPCADRAVLTNIIAADKAARKALDALAAYVRAHPTLDATDLYTAAKAAVTKLQGATPAA